MPMLQIVYISSARDGHSDESLQAILAASRRHNRLSGVTGLLLAGGRRFLQALEGPDESLLATYARIEADPRHYALVQLGLTEVEKRAFGEWEMAYQPAGTGSDATGMTDVVSTMVGALEDKALRSQFLGFARLHARAA